MPEIWLIDAEREQWHVDLRVEQRYESRVLSGGRFGSRVLGNLSIDPEWLWGDTRPNPIVCLPGP